MVNRAEIKSFCRSVAQRFRPRAIILFGSYAYGHPTPDSDVDLLVIMPKTRDRGERMSVRIRHAVPRSFPLDLMVRTPKEVAQRVGWGDVFFSEVMKKGRVMYEANDTRVGEKREKMISPLRLRFSGGAKTSCPMPPASFANNAWRNI